MQLQFHSKSETQYSSWEVDLYRLQLQLSLLRNSEETEKLHDWNYSDSLDLTIPRCSIHRKSGDERT
jgi:hypothetical protein